MSKDIELIRGSIEKWEKVVKGKEKGLHYSNCPLCNEYLVEHACNQCPIKLKTGRSGCRGTPYEGYHLMDDEWFELDSKKERVHSLELAKQELQFLKDLLNEYVSKMQDGECYDEKTNSNDKGEINRV